MHRLTNGRQRSVQLLEVGQACSRNRFLRRLGPTSPQSMEYQPVSQEEEAEVVTMGEKEEVISMTEVMVDVEGGKTPSSPLVERFDLEKQFHMNQVSDV